MAKKNVDFNTYVERDLSKSSIDWSTISKTKITNFRIFRKSCL